MAVVARVLLDHVAQDPAQARCPAVGPGAPGQPAQAAVGHRLGDGGARAGRGVLPQRKELLRRVPGGLWAPVKRRNAVKTTLFRYLTPLSKVNRHIRTRLPCVPTKVSKK